VALFFWVSLFPVRAGFSSLSVFGDALSTTTNNPSVGSLYYGMRRSNGRVWVEVLAQRQGLNYDPNKNFSYYDHNSSSLLTQIKSSPATYTANDLVILWVCNSDTFDSAQSSANSGQWIVNNSQSQTNHLQIITNLYAKGVRTLILPNAVDISKVPAFNQGSLTSVMSAGCIDYNTKFTNTLYYFKTNPAYSGLKIYAPDFFKLLNNVITNAAYYGLSNALLNGKSIDALSDLPNAATNGPGTNYVFWDPENPTAKFHAVIADEAQKLLPQVARISKITLLTGSNRLDVVDMPGGLNGFVEGATNLAPANWATNLAAFASSNTTPSVFVPASGPQRFYRLRIPYYPYIWSWP